MGNETFYGDGLNGFTAGGVWPTIAVHCGCQIFKMAAKGRENE